MKTADLDLLTQKTAQAIENIACNMEASCRAALEEARRREDSPTARFALDVMCDNADIAAKKGFPVCQDTGMAVIFLNIGRELYLPGDVYEAVNEGVRRGYKQLRKSVLDPVTRVNTGDNTPAVIHTRLTDGDRISAEIMLKGFGSENMSKVFMLNPAQGFEEAKRLIIDAVASAGSNPCPPVIVGVGLGGTLEKACELSKHALFRKIGSSNPDPELDKTEKYLLGEINALGIGAQGFGGRTSALAVFIEKFPTHISSLPVAVNMLCHCSRATSFEI